MALDFLGRHEEALAEYRKASELKASSTAKERAEERLNAGKKDPGALSLLELHEMARILMDTGTHTEKELRMLEDKLTGPSRVLSKGKSDLYYEIARDLAEARMRRGDAEECVAAIDRIMKSSRQTPTQEKALLLEVRARALARLGRIDEAKSDLKSARSKAGGDARKLIDREIEALSTGHSSSILPPGAARPARHVQARDRGELTLEVEVRSPGNTSRIPMDLQGAHWISRALPESSEDLLYRFVANGLSPRIDPAAPRTVMIVDQAWSVYPKQTNSSISQ
jgi:tetratricopeptide (TPR) repeat protein